ncbi:MAG: sugar-binding protein [Candidatus Hinthialibacter antarcticus]|nr:sugar-binding protein [Candidatus Hinthialibacter antarcticus]
MATVGYTQAEPVAWADFEVDVNGWWTEEHAIGMIWSEEGAGPGSFGSIATLIDPNQPDDDSPESKVAGNLPEGINIADYEYVSFYYKCDSDAYTGNTMFLMPMVGGGASGAGASHSGTMIGDGEWHYEEYHISEFSNWWGEWSWDATDTLVIGVWETNDRGECEMFYDHVMLFNTPGDGVLLAQEGAPEITQTVPASGAQLSALSEITISFNQAVEGVADDGSNLLVNGQPATSVTTSNNRIFVFTGFPEPTGDTADIEVVAGDIKTANGDAFAGYSFSIGLYSAKSYTAPFAAVAPTMDGVIDSGEYAGDMVNSWKDSLGAQDPESDTDWNAEWTATHDANYVYVAFRAADDVRETAADAWAQDNVEFFIDGPNLKDGTGNQFRANWDGTEWTTSANENWEFTVGDTGDGWIVEARFEKSVLDIPADGSIGFNIQPSDNDDGTRGTYHFWEDSPANNNPWDNAASWGNMVLVPGTSNVTDWSLN